MQTRYSRNRKGVFRVHYSCQHCNLSLRSLLVEAGRTDHCPDCRCAFTVPGLTKQKEAQEILKREAEECANKKETRRRETAEQMQRVEEMGKKAKQSIFEFIGQTRAMVENAVENAIRDNDENEQIVIFDKLIIGRSHKHAGWLVPDRHVSQRHAGVFWQTPNLNLIDLDSKIGTILNGIRIAPNKVFELKDSDIVQVGPARFKVDGQSLRVVSQRSHAHLACTDLCKDVVSSDDGRPKRILNNVNLSIAPRTFVALLGPSGSGKSTLLNALSGRSPASLGEVKLNREELYGNFHRLKTRMATVQQKDLLHSRLSLNSALGYTAALRLPKDQTESERLDRVRQVIHEVEMSEQANSMIATYSGGQLKRASLANELLSNPSLLFVDEATSGLDEHSDREIMSMLRGLADAGKTIVCITHNLGNVPKYVHKLVVMANGGYVAFVGSPTETLQYFSIEDLGDLYVRLKERSGKEWSRLFNQTQGVGRRANTQLAAANQIQIERESSSPWQKLKSLHSQCSVSLKRTIELQKKDKKSLSVAIAQPILVFMLIWVVFGNITETPKFQYARGLSVIFLLGISAFWFGCSNSAKEIVKERELFERERNAGLSPFAYIFSKVIFLFGLTMLQSLFLLITVKFATGLDGSLFWYGLPITMTSICGVGLGLAISALSANADVASTAVPLAIIPQVILAGMIKPLENLPEYIAWFAAPSYWCFGSMSKTWNEHLNNQVISDGMLSQQKYGLSLFALLTFTLIFFLICGLSLSEKSIAYLKSKK